MALIHKNKCQICRKPAGVKLTSASNENEDQYYCHECWETVSDATLDKRKWTK